MVEGRSWSGCCACVTAHCDLIVRSGSGRRADLDELLMGFVMMRHLVVDVVVVKALHLVDVVVREMLEHAGHVDVLFDGGPVQSHPQLLGQPLNFISVKQKTSIQLSSHIYTIKVSRLQN